MNIFLGIGSSSTQIALSNVGFPAQVKPQQLKDLPIKGGFDQKITCH